MSDLKSGLILGEGETLVMELEAELWATSSNPIAMALGNLKKFVAKILGTKRTGFLVLTNKRVVEVSNMISCYVFNIGRTVKYLLPSSVKEIGYTKAATCGMFCPAYYLYYESFTQTTSILLSGADEAAAQKTVDAFYKAIAAAQTGNAYSVQISIFERLRIFIAFLRNNSGIGAFIQGFKVAHCSANFCRPALL